MTVSLLRDNKISDLADPAGKSEFQPKKQEIQHKSADLADRQRVLGLLADASADIAEDDYAAILDNFRHETRIHRALIGRAELPFAVVARLIRLVAGEADVQELIQRHGTPHLPMDWRRSTRSRPDWWGGAR